MGELCVHWKNLMVLCSFLLPLLIGAECECEEGDTDQNKSKVLGLKLAAIASILAAGTIGVSLPTLGQSVPALHPEKDIFFVVKAFAAGVILATGMVHILPDAFKNLTSSCLKGKPWEDFPFAGFVAMLAAIGTLMIEANATGYYKRLHFSKAQLVDGGINGEEHAGHVHMHTHATHGHAHGEGFTSSESTSGDLIRQRIVSQVLEMGIVVHSVIIGISLGASGSPSRVKVLIAALCFHQFFEGMGLGGCIAQARFEARSTIIMAIFFSFTTPVGIGIGMGIFSLYNENSRTALIVEGLMNAASAGILVYMALVDILAADFMSLRMQSNGKLQAWTNASLLLGAGCMSVLAKWA